MVLKRIFRGGGFLVESGFFGLVGSSNAPSVEVLSEGGVTTVCSNSSGGGVVTVSSLAFKRFCNLSSELSPRSGVFLGGEYL